ncbi:MaoC family dehydratase [Kosakonia radicincitans]|uniref:MaoC family dehydratase n=1 Tax=Kosakonia radicincitans TaxID=283686 RepID=UPI0005C2C56D|nr:MaoC family dehydratase [Kosakonia radicincitans]KIS44078.1 maoC like domain protein [Kosakonia radicincitans YD4]
MTERAECLQTGQKAQFTKKLTEEDVINFAEASGDMNPVHLDDDAGKKSIFGQRVVHGILVSGLISAVIANKLPGKGSIYLAQDLKFTKPTFIGDTVTATVEIIAIDTEKKRVSLKTTCTNQHGDVVIKGEALMLSPAVKH